MNMITTRNSDNSLTTSILNNRNIEVAKWENHNFPGEPLLTMARQFEDEHPELFGDDILVDSAAESERKNPKQYGDGNLIPIPEA